MQCGGRPDKAPVRSAGLRSALHVLHGEEGVRSNALTLGITFSFPPSGSGVVGLSSSLLVLSLHCEFLRSCFGFYISSGKFRRYSGVALLCRTSAPPERVTFGLPGGAASEVALTEGRIATAESDGVDRYAFAPFAAYPCYGQFLREMQGPTAYLVSLWPFSG